MWSRPFGFLIWFAVAVVWLASTSMASAQSITLTMEEDPTGISLAGSGTAAVSMQFGNIGAVGGTLPFGLDRTTGSTSWTLTTRFRVNVIKDFAGSANYTLRAENKDDDTMTWKVDGVTLPRAVVTTVSTVGTYGTAEQHTLALTIPNSRADGAFANTIEVYAIGN